MAESMNNGKNVGSSVDINDKIIDTINDSEIINKNLRDNVGSINEIKHSNELDEIKEVNHIKEVNQINEDTQINDDQMEATKDSNISGNLILTEDSMSNKKSEAIKGKDMVVNFKYFLLLALAFGFLFMYTFYDFYENFNGILYPVFVIGLFLSMRLAFIKLGKEISLASKYYCVMGILLGISSALTNNGFIVFFNTLAIMLLYGFFVLKTIYPGKQLDIIEAMVLFIQFTFISLSNILVPFGHYKTYYKDKKIDSNKIKPIVQGLLFAILFLSIVIPLLASSDLIFGKVIENLLPNIILPYKGWLKYIILTLVGATMFYGLLVTIADEKEYKYNHQTPKVQAISMITMTWFVAAVYVFYCIIQIVFLFGGNLFTLPSDITYAIYARRGFFQLVAVATLNLSLVLINVSNVKEHKWLDKSLYIISGCTFIMILSATYRMILYVRAYHLTFIRVLVLWFLLVLTICMAGMLFYIANKTFYIYKFLFLTFMIGYIIFGFMRPDYLVAKYNISQMDVIEMNDLEYLLGLSLDATPAIDDIEEVQESEGYIDNQRIRYTNTKDQLDNYYNVILHSNQKGFRYFNLSRWMAYDSANEYFR